MTLDSILNLTQKYPFVLSFFLGLLPALIWLWFWLKEDTHPEPAKMVTLSFFGGMVAVVFVLPLQKIVYDYIQNQEILSFTLWAGIEEILKFGFVYFIALRNKKVTDEPVDDIIYLIVSALGFVTFENTLFLIPSVANGNFLNVIIHGNLRFVGASLLHIMSSGAVGICMALAFYKSQTKKMLHVISGLAIAIVLHTSFNLLIISGAEKNNLLIFGLVWVGIIGLLLMFERVKHIKETPNLDNPQN
ncbi:MAG: PrsW family glutamic-type intramembrane protease [Candidatus Paceibacterota bacterium]|jgi:RsiW-degrading membrane proteinase PrsW (M82 family)